MFAVIAHFIFYSIYNHFQYKVSFKDVVVFFVFNQPFAVDGALWFLFALLYTYCLYAVVNQFNLYKIAYITAFILLIIFVFLGQGMHLLGKHIPNYIYRNFLFEGFPCFMLGHFLHYQQDKIHAKNMLLIGILTVSTGLCLVERYLLGRDFGINISSFPQVISLFLLGVKNSGKMQGVIQTVGKKASLYVYIIHKPLWHCVERIYSLLHIDNNLMALYLMPIVVVCLSLALAFLCYRIVTEIKTKRDKRMSA